MTNIVFLRLANFVSLFSDADISVDAVAAIPLRQLAGSPAYASSQPDYTNNFQRLALTTHPLYRQHLSKYCIFSSFHTAGLIISNSHPLPLILPQPNNSSWKHFKPICINFLLTTPQQQHLHLWLIYSLKKFATRECKTNLKFQYKNFSVNSKTPTNNTRLSPLFQET